MFDILVIGSMNVDQVIKTDVIPKIGETVIGNTFSIVPGGKGANQAVAAARMGANVGFIGCVGLDSNGTFLIENFEKNNINTANIERKDISTGIASITVYNNSNSIIVVPGANFEVTTELIKKEIDVIKNSKLVLLQLEIPLDTVKYIVDLCYEFNIPVVLNPAPAQNLDQEIIDKVTFLTPNEHETETIFKTNNFEELVNKYPNKLIITLGEKGAMYSDGTKVINIDAFKVPVIDTTGAGDTFNGVLSYYIIQNKKIEDAVVLANMASALKIGKFGAQTGMPTKKELESFYEKVWDLK